VVKAEIPGVEQEDINVSLLDQVPTIKGEKHHEKEEKDQKYHRVERSWGAFTRAFRMPVAVSGEKMTATFNDGMLTGHLAESARGQGHHDTRQERVAGGRGGTVSRYKIREAVPIADCAMEVEGDDLDDPFAIAAAAGAELMVDGHRPAHRRAPCPVQRARTASRSGVAEEAWHRLQGFGHQDING
jgi:hypothetical protein